MQGHPSSECFRRWDLNKPMFWRPQGEMEGSCSSFFYPTFIMMLNLNPCVSWLNVLHRMLVEGQAQWSLTQVTALTWPWVFYCHSYNFLPSSPLASLIFPFIYPYYVFFYFHVFLSSPVTTNLRIMVPNLCNLGCDTY